MISIWLVVAAVLYWLISLFVSVDIVFDDLAHRQAAKSEKLAATVFFTLAPVNVALLSVASICVFVIYVVQWIWKKFKLTPLQLKLTKKD